MANDDSQSSLVLQYAQQNFIGKAVIERLSATITDPEDMLKIIQAIHTPPQYYNLRINLSKISPENALSFTQNIFPTVPSQLGSLPNVLQIPITKKEVGKLHDRIVYCDKFAAESIMLGANLFVPGIKGFNGKFPKGEAVSITLAPKNYPEIVKNSDFTPDELEKYFHIANGEAMISSRDFPKYLKGIFVKNHNPLYSIPDYRDGDLYKKGWITEQNLPPNLASAIFMEKYLKVFPESTGLIIDTCSAPGHKTSALAEWGFYLSRSQGKPKWPKIISIDRSTNRLEHLRNDITRLGLQNIEVLACNLRKLLKLRPELEKSADFLMFDPPCSALGTRPKIFLDKTMKDLLDYPVNQRRLLKIVDNLVKPGGFLMYNTCTIPKEENEDIIAYAVHKLGYKVVSIPKKYRKIGQPGISRMDLSDEECQQMIRFYPGLNDSIGYFIAFLQKESK
ncbi:PUA domain-containing protein [Candidatus Lokiarchaeum ossiferum]|uniref:PUA domain-containing protein n=1 Tax=Candidatus Lokiarchaeum ossiferum TaxID=2951803 RepID=UPI00352D300D